MLRASYYAGCAFTKSYVGYVHAVAHSLGGAYNVPHGLANAVLLPFVLEAYGPVVYPKLHVLAIAAGLADKNTPDEEAAKTFIAAIQAMKKRYGIGDHIPEIREEDIPKLARYADKEGNPLYPVPVLMDRKKTARLFLHRSHFKRRFPAGRPEKTESCHSETPGRDPCRNPGRSWKKRFRELYVRDWSDLK